MSAVNDILSPETLKKAGDIEIFDENEKKMKFSTLVAEKQTLVVFIRHFLCGNCMEYVCCLSTHLSPLELHSQNLNLIIIGCGSPTLLTSYITETQSKFPIYSDPSQRLFKQFSLIRTLSLGDRKPDYMSFGVMGGIVRGVGLGIKAGLGAFKAGDMKQVGGEFLIGPGEVCHWGHRMTNTRDHTEIDELRKILKLNTIPEKDKVPGNEVETTVPVSEISNNAIDTPVS